MDLLDELDGMDLADRVDKASCVFFTLEDHVFPLRDAYPRVSGGSSSSTKSA
jgi:hypothetical protein